MINKTRQYKYKKEQEEMKKRISKTKNEQRNRQRTTRGDRGGEADQTARQIDRLENV
ncbi:MAG TPA: hypothetical protein VHA52_07585 [Candidatus Babeliaceae bacterium]|nr:hypothetical protein [Candidatus Babeliaceae bacterium]